LTEYAWRFRYPGEPAEPPLDEARAALAVAERAVRAIVRSLPVDLEG
jgi:hypothetical protein